MLSSYIYSYLPSRYERKEHRSRQQPIDLNTIPRQRSPLLPISNNGSTRTIFKHENVWSHKENNLSAANAALYTPLFLPAVGDYLYPRPAPLPPSTAVQRLPYNTFSPHRTVSYVQQHFKPRSPRHNIDRRHAIDTAPASQPAYGRQDILAPPQVPRVVQASIPRISKRSRLPLSPAAHTRDEGLTADSARKRVRFSADPPRPSDFERPAGLYAHNTRPAELSSDHLLPFGDWVAHRCNNIFTDTSSWSQWLMTPQEESTAAKRIVAILWKLFPEDATTVTFLALWYLDRLFHHGIFSPSDVQSIGAPEAVVRGFLLGLTLADKWLNDSTRPIREWKRFCHLPLFASNLAEKTALMMLDYNISITKPEWRRWLSMLEPSASRCTSGNFAGQMTAATALKDVRLKDARESISPHGTFYVREEQMCPKLLFELREHLLGEGAGSVA